MKSAPLFLALLLFTNSRADAEQHALMWISPMPARAFPFRHSSTCVALRQGVKESVRYKHARMCVRQGSTPGSVDQLSLDEQLWQASADGDIDLIQSLLKSGANVNAQQPYPDDPLPSDSERRSYPGFTALHMAAMMNRPEAIHILAGAGGDLNARTEALTTPMHIAAVHGRMNAVQALFELGADVNAKNEFGSDPLKMAKLSMGRHQGTIALLEHLTNTPHEPWADTAITGC